MSDKEDFLLQCKFSDVINYSWEIVSASLVITVVPEVRARAAGFEGGVIARVSVAACVHQPNIVSLKQHQNQ